MANSIAGRKARVKYATVLAGPYTAVGGIKSFQHSIDGTTIDDSEMGVDWIQRILGLKDGKITLSGSRRPGEAGQDAIRDALLNDTSLFIQVLPDGGTTIGAGFQQEVKVSKFGTDADVADKNNLSIELEGTGAITTV